MNQRQYKDVAGNPCSLRWLVNNEPEWAINQIIHRDKLETERDALHTRATSLQRLLDQRWEIMRELEEACGAKDVAKAVEYIKGLKTRVQRLEEALEIGVGLNRARELMSDNHVGEPNEMVAVTKEVPCPDCYGGHFRPCNICGDSGVALLRIETKESKP